MSNFLAIATVTEALHQLLQAEVDDDVNNVEVTTLRPEAAAGNQNPRVNIYPLSGQSQRGAAESRSPSARRGWASSATPGRGAGSALPVFVLWQ